MKDALLDEVDTASEKKEDGKFQPPIEAINLTFG